MLTESTITALRDVSIVDIIGRHITLKKHGANYTACCPFHNEKSSSFSVSPVRNIYKCFGCGVGGDGLQFIRAYCKLDFMEAAEAVAEIGNVQIEREQNFDQATYELKKVERKGLQLLMDECAARYVAELWKDGSPGMAYLRDERGYDNSTISAWRLGYAPDANTISQHYHATGNTPELVKLGLITEGDNYHYDFFKARVLFPILNERGELVSFGGRTLLPDFKPKYLNTSSTDLYDKSRTLYGLYQAAKSIKEMKYAVITEGYTDVISLHRAGLTNAVATCGTALTEDHCRLLKKHTDRVLLMRDGDPAGIKATSKDIPLLLRAGLGVDVLPLEAGIDPDDFAKQFLSNQTTATAASNVNKI